MAIARRKTATSSFIFRQNDYGRSGGNKEGVAARRAELKNLPAKPEGVGSYLYSFFCFPRDIQNKEREIGRAEKRNKTQRNSLRSRPELSAASGCCCCCCSGRLVFRPVFHTHKTRLKVKKKRKENKTLVFSLTSAIIQSNTHTHARSRS